MVSEARLLATSKFPTLQLLGRPGAVMINATFIRDLCRKKNWRFKRIMGCQKLLLPHIVPTSDKEIKKELEG